jgi:hypothetical protein
MVSTEGRSRQEIVADAMRQVGEFKAQQAAGPTGPGTDGGIADRAPPAEVADSSGDGGGTTSPA